MSEEHVCLSGTVACSGANPCRPCAALTDERVLPAALVAAGLNGALLALVHCFAQALYQRGVDPSNLALSQTGVPLSSVFTSPEQQAQAFRQAYREAWGRMLVAMQTEPALLAMVVRTPIGEAPPPFEVETPLSPPPAAQQELPLEARVAPVVLGSVAAPSEARPPSPVQALPPELIDTAAYEAFVRKTRAAPTVQAPPIGPQPSVVVTTVEEAARADLALRMSEPMDAEDIAAAGLAVAPPAPASSATLPNGSPPVLG